VCDMFSMIQSFMEQDEVVDGRDGSIKPHGISPSRRGNNVEEHI